MMMSGVRLRIVAAARHYHYYYYRKIPFDSCARARACAPVQAERFCVAFNVLKLGFLY